MKWLALTAQPHWMEKGSFIKTIILVALCHPMEKTSRKLLEKVLVRRGKRSWLILLLICFAVVELEHDFSFLSSEWGKSVQSVHALQRQWTKSLKYESDALITYRFPIPSRHCYNISTCLYTMIYTTTLLLHRRVQMHSCGWNYRLYNCRVFRFDHCVFSIHV